MRSPFTLAFALTLAVTACGEAPPPVVAPPTTALPAKPMPVTAAPTAPAPIAAAPVDLDPTAAPLTAAGMRELCDTGLRRAELLMESVKGLANAPAEQLTWASTLGALDAMHLAMRSAGDFPELMAVAHPDKAVRDAARDCSPKVERLRTALLLDSGALGVVRRYADRVAAGGDAILGGATPESNQTRRRYLERMLIEWKRNGAALDGQKKARLVTLNEEINTKMQAFTANLASGTLSLEVEATSLAGLPEPYVAKHPKGENGKVRITTDYPDYFPFVQYAKDRKAALELQKLFDNRAADKNVPLLESLLKLRKEKAALLGYTTWADYVLELRMAKTPKTVATFLDDLAKHLGPRVKAEMGELRAAHAKLGGKATDPLPPSDRLYLEELVRKAKYGVDSKEVSEYFEIERVRAGLLTITGELFGITYREMKPGTFAAWHPDVSAIEVLRGGEVIGRFFMDLHPRDGKYKHAAVFSIRDTRQMEDGKRLLPIAAIVCNFPRTKDGTPGLMSHNEVSTFFHEFGHVLHHVLSRAELSSFAGTNVARDFVEAPSQMLEEWTWSKPVLARFAKHHKTDKPLPDALLTKMIRARSFGRAVHTQRQLFLAGLDQAYHAVAEPPADTTQTVRDVWTKIMPFAYLEGTHFQGTFGHLMEYDAGYYGYQWALAIARDLFSRFEREGIMSAKASSDYLKKVIEPGSSAEEGRLIEAFLGRPFSPDRYKAFLSNPTGP